MTPAERDRLGSAFADILARERGAARLEERERCVRLVESAAVRQGAGVCPERPEYAHAVRVLASLANEIREG